MTTKCEQKIVVVPWNFTELSMFTLDRALEMVDAQAIIRVVYVAAPLAVPEAGFLYDVAEKQRCNEWEAQFREQIAGDPRMKSVRFHVVYGEQAREIARFAELYQAELIVMGARERAGLSSFLFPGLAERVVRLAGCPVFVHKLTAPRKPTGWRQRQQTPNLQQKVTVLA